MRMPLFVDGSESNLSITPTTQILSGTVPTWSYVPANFELTGVKNRRRGKGFNKSRVNDNGLGCDDDDD